MKPKAIDFFAGAGGLSKGLEKAGFDIVAASELSDIYAKTFEKNHPKARLYQGDIRDLTVQNVLKDNGMEAGDLDLLAGGPPCQGFSINAPIRSMQDQRNHLFTEFLRFVEGMLPKTILIENVPGLISVDKGVVVKSIYSALNSLGYNVHHMILYAAHYGIPQMRWRTIFLGSRNDADLPQFPFPTHRAIGVANFTGSRKLCFQLYPEDGLFSEDLEPHTSVHEAISDLTPLQNGAGSEEADYALPPQSEYQENLRQSSKRLWNHKTPRLHAINLQRMKYIEPGGSWRDIPYDLLPRGLQRARRSDHTRRYGRLDPEGLATTIMTKCDPHWGTFFHYDQDRIITVREAARLQSFPDNFRFYGSLIQQYQQVGNAVPPILGQKLGEQILGALDKIALTCAQA